MNIQVNFEQYNLNKAVLTTMGAVMNWGTKWPKHWIPNIPKNEQIVIK